MKKKILLFIVIFSIGIIITYPAFVPSHSLDSYCTIYNGYVETGNWFLQNGRVFSALLMYFYNLVSLPVDSMNFVAVFFLNLFLALAILKLYLVLENTDNKVLKIILLMSVFMLFYGPLITEVLFFDEAMILGLSILFVTLSAYKVSVGGIKNYIIASILMILGVACYQGTACYFFAILLLCLMKNKIKDKDDMINLFKKMGIGIVIYGLSFLSTLGVIKLMENVLNVSNTKFGSFNIFDNLTKIFTDLLPSALQNLFGFVNTKIYYFLTIALIGIIIYLIVKSDKKAIKITLLVGIILTLILVPFIPNLVMSSSSNYTAARMALTLGIFPSALALYIIFNFDINIKLHYGIGIIVLLFMGLSAYSIHQNAMISYKRYTKDISYISSITERIGWYEAESGEEVTTIYYAKDTDVAYYYSSGNANGANIRLLAVDWALECAFPAYTSSEYEFLPMSDEDYEKYFAGKNYDEFDSEQLVFEGDTLYLLLY